MAPGPGACTACGHGRPLSDALDMLPAHGLTSVEGDTGGFTPSPHYPVDGLLSSERARRGEGLTARIPEIATGLRAGSGQPPHR
jgi:hypothetical protein